MPTDTLGRRLRDKAEPRGRRIELSERDWRVLRALRRHSPLPTPLLFEFYRNGEAAHYNSFQDRLKKLFHGTAETPALLVRPRELNPPGPNAEPAWYSLSNYGDELARTEIPLPRMVKRDPLHHRGATACVTASIELLAHQHGLRFVHLEEILLHPNTPVAIRNSRAPLKVGSYEPDQLFGLTQVATGRSSFFVLEMDRGTESFGRNDKAAASIDQKIANLTRILNGGNNPWALPNLRAAFVFTSLRRADHLRRRLARSLIANRLIIDVATCFARTSWSAPRSPAANLMHQLQ